MSFITLVHWLVINKLSWGLYSPFTSAIDNKNLFDHMFTIKSLDILWYFWILQDICNHRTPSNILGSGIEYSSISWNITWYFRKFHNYAKGLREFNKIMNRSKSCHDNPKNGIIFYRFQKLSLWQVDQFWKLNLHDYKIIFTILDTS